jgi:hypothetical protein
MPMKSPQAAIMRKIAADAVEKVFGDLLPEEEEGELVTSVVRQWLTYDGHAALLKETESYYLVFRQQREGYGLTVDQVEGEVLHPFLRDWQIDGDQVHEILHRLNIGQSAEVANRSGKVLRFSMDPKERSILLDDPNRCPLSKKQEPPPLFCPHCSAVLSPWQSDLAEQQCPLCKRPVRP